MALRGSAGVRGIRANPAALDRLGAGRCGVQWEPEEFPVGGSLGDVGAVRLPGGESRENWVGVLPLTAQQGPQDGGP